MKLISILLILSLMITSMSMKKIIVRINKFSDLKTSKICLNIRDKLELIESEFTDMTVLYDNIRSDILYGFITRSYTAEKEGECYFSFYRQVDEIKKAIIVAFDYFNIFRVKKFIYVKISNEHEFLESDCDNSRFEIEGKSEN